MALIFHEGDRFIFISIVQSRVTTEVETHTWFHVRSIYYQKKKPILLRNYSRMAVEESHVLYILSLDCCLASLIIYL